MSCLTAYIAQGTVTLLLPKLINLKIIVLLLLTPSYPSFVFSTFFFGEIVFNTLVVLEVANGPDFDP